MELSGLSAAISHFLNCFLSSYPNPVAHLPADELISKKRNRRRRNRPPGAADNTAWAVMTPQELWKNICQEAKNYFDFSLEWCVSSTGALGPQHEGLWGPRPVVAGCGLGEEEGSSGGCLLGEWGWGSWSGSWLVSTWYSGGEAAVEKGAKRAGLPRPTCCLSPSETVDQAVETYGLQKITLLREISLKTGIQVG